MEDDGYLTEFDGGYTILTTRHLDATIEVLPNDLIARMSYRPEFCRRIDDTASGQSRWIMNSADQPSSLFFESDLNWPNEMGKPAAAVDRTEPELQTSYSSGQLSLPANSSAPNPSGTKKQRTALAGGKISAKTKEHTSPAATMGFINPKNLMALPRDSHRFPRGSRSIRRRHPAYSSGKAPADGQETRPDGSFTFDTVSARTQGETESVNTSEEGKVLDKMRAVDDNLKDYDDDQIDVRQVGRRAGVLFGSARAKSGSPDDDTADGEYVERAVDRRTWRTPREGSDAGRPRQAQVPPMVSVPPTVSQHSSSISTTMPRVRASKVAHMAWDFSMRLSLEVLHTNGYITSRDDHERIFEHIFRPQLNQMGINTVQPGSKLGSQWGERDRDRPAGRTEPPDWTRIKKGPQDAGDRAAWAEMKTRVEAAAQTLGIALS